MGSLPAREVASDSQNGDPRAELAQLRELLLGPEQEKLRALQKRLDDPALRTEELSQLIAEAIAIRARGDHSLQRSLQPIVEDALRISVARNPAILANSLYPIIGEAVRKSVAHALREMTETLNQVLERSFSLESLKWRVEALRTGRSFGEIALMRSFRYRVEEIFLIHRETGLLLQHVARHKPVMDADMVSGMVTAIQDFVRDSFGAKKTADLETMEVGEMNVWLQHGPDAILAAVVSGTPPAELRNIFARGLESVHGDYSEQLRDFNGDAAPFAATRANLDSCLLGRDGVKAGKSYKWAWALGSLLAVIAVAVGLYYRSNARWADAINRLKAEPGIVVTESGKTWRHYSVSGLRDPLATDPKVILGAAGIDLHRVTENWRPYLSADQHFVHLRHLLSLKDEIQREALHFPVDSSHIAPESAVFIDILGSQIRELQNYASEENRSVIIEIDGRSDPTGKEERNARLSEERALKVRNALIANGIQPELLKTAAFGATVPAELAHAVPDLNRRVDLRITITPQ